MDFNFTPTIKSNPEYFAMVSAALQEGHAEEIEEEAEHIPAGDE